jgi:hypothetical protein
MQEDRYGIEINTTPAGASNMDTRIWMRKADGSLVPISDDVGTDKLARVKVYLDCILTRAPAETRNFVELLIAAKSKADNAGSFNLVQTTGESFGTGYYNQAPFVYGDGYGYIDLFRTN